MSSSLANKDGIRLAKWWAINAITSSRRRRPRGFLIETLAMHASSNGNRMSAPETLLSILRLITDWRELTVTWNWRRSDWQRVHRSCDPPVVLDPCNITNNVARYLGRAGWRKWATLAAETLRSLSSSSMLSPASRRQPRQGLMQPLRQQSFDLVDEFGDLSLLDHPGDLSDVCDVDSPIDFGDFGDADVFGY